MVRPFHGRVGLKWGTATGGRATIRGRGTATNQCVAEINLAELALLWASYTKITRRSAFGRPVTGAAPHEREPSALEGMYHRRDFRRGCVAVRREAEEDWGKQR
jgi:hypothetical protein